MVTFLSSLDYWKLCYQGMEEMAKYFNVTARYTGSNDANPTEQVAVLEQVIAQKPKGIAIACVDANLLTDTINLAINQGIQVITFDTDSPTSNRGSYVSTGNEAAGVAAAQFLAAQINNRGKIAVVYTTGSENQETRLGGFRNWLRVNAPNVSTVVVNDGGDTTRAAANAAAALQANPDIAAVWCNSGISSFTVPQAVKEAGLNIKILTSDVDKSVLDMLKAGETTGTLAQGCYNMGYWSMNFLYHLVHELPAKSLPGFVDTGSTIVTRGQEDAYYVK
jgi:ribose transport system substrate-binding protein